MEVVATPDHFYLATFDEMNISQTTDTEPRFLTYYTIRRGPYSDVMTAWEDAWLRDEDWDKAVVLGFKGVTAIHAYHAMMDDTPTEGALAQGPAEDALFESNFHVHD